MRGSIRGVGVTRGDPAWKSAWPESLALATDDIELERERDHETDSRRERGDSGPELSDSPAAAPSDSMACISSSI